MKTRSEEIIGSINSGVFFKEFTFHQTQFISTSGTKELADSFVWLDDLLFVIQVKERNLSEVKTAEEENRWFSGAIKKAKKQIEDSLAFLKSGKEIRITNFRGHVIDVSKVGTEGIHKLIVYMPGAEVLTEENRAMKFYESSRSGSIHVLHIEDYYAICRILVTPGEISEYFKFRERIFLRHRKLIGAYPEQYMLSHFLHTPDEAVIDENYITSLHELEDDSEEWDVSEIIGGFADRLLGEESTRTDYYHILKQIARLTREDLAMFKERFYKMTGGTRSAELSPPNRFTSPRTGCGFVFMSLPEAMVRFRESALMNLTEIYKYKRRLKKCVGIIANRAVNSSVDICWAYIEREWSFDEEMETLVKTEEETYGTGRTETVVRYRFKDKNSAA